MSYNAKLYKHDLDQKAFDALSGFPRFTQLKKAYIENVDEKAAKIDFLSKAIRLNNNQFSKVYSLLPPICDKLEITVPELFYVQSKEMNAFTIGNTSPVVVVTSKLIEEIPIDLIGSVLAHECGHIACEHYLYHSMAISLINGVDKSPLALIPGIRKYLTPALIKALLFWDRCSELSADRAAVLCDETPEKTVDVLLKAHGYKDINRDEFVKQALDLKEYVNDSKSNKLMELMLTQNETHPRLATRAYECYEWSKTAQYFGIINGTYTYEDKQRDCTHKEEQEVISAEIEMDAKAGASNINVDEVNHALAKVNSELERYTNKADKSDYAFAVFSGIISGAIDALFIGEINITDADIALSHQQVNNFIQEYAKAKGYDKDRLKDAITDLEKNYVALQDNVWKGEGIGVSAKNHHLADLAHHPTPVGLASSIIVQFLRVGIFVNKDGEWHLKLVKTGVKDVIDILAPAAITGILNWLVVISEKKYEQDNQTLPKALDRIARLVASTPIIIEIAKCADNWFGHLVSDMGGSKNTAGGGMGIPGIFISLMYEIAALPILKDSGLPKYLDDLYQMQKLDLRHEIPLYKAAGKQAIPVVFNEIYVRLGFFISNLAIEIAAHKNLKEINWNNVIPFNNRTVDRMLAVASMTFNVADTADAAVHAAIESGGNWVLFSGKFITRYNYVGAGRAAIAVVKEVSNEARETQLIHEKMILSETKAAIFLQQLQQFKYELEEKVSNYLAEDIESFMTGFDYMNQGLETGNSDIVIKGNVTIQKVLGREPQFTTQAEFDNLMDSDVPLIL